MFEVLRNAWRVKDLRRKLLYTIMMLLLFRLCTYIPTPFIDQSAIKQAVGANSGWGVIDIITGGSLSGYTFMAMGITPYINASIILQLLTVVIPRLEQLSKEGPEGRKKITQYTRYLGIILAFVQAVGICMSFGSSAIVSTFRDNLFLVYVIIGLTLTAGSALAIWMGERITENGIGNGISMLIFIGIIARLPSTVIAYVQQAAAQAREGNAALWWILPVIILAVAALVVIIVRVDLGERRIPVQYAKRISGRKVYGGQSTYIPMKPNGAGVLPLIFAMSFLAFPNIIIKMFWPHVVWYDNWLGAGTPLYAVLSVVLVLFFAYFYASISFNPEETANDIQKYGGFIQGIRPGKPTSDYLKKINRRLTLFAGLFLAGIAVLPMIISAILGNMENSAPILNLALTFSSTGLLILPSVSIEVTKQLEAQLVMNHYKGFLDK